MSDRQRLERLMTLRERRERLTQAALMEQHHRCQAEARRIDRLDGDLARERSDFDRLEREWFDAMQGTTLSAQELEQARQAIDDHYRRQAELTEARRAADLEHRRQLAERERCASEWVRRTRARQALGSLLERHRRADHIAAEGRHELDIEDDAPRGGH
ncbi:hypothetical protein [Halomonas maura]|uniref:hypothetical protein n=1 Tax=Halomonas maura TaxID=117606 RepID=UPI0025B29DAA|nr:hypothetical protein [Halomonas maura]MDN3556906.1 hypothetical protein [Halomonas maura]